MRANLWSSTWAARDFTRPWGRCVRSRRICKACFQGTCLGTLLHTGHTSLEAFAVSYCCRHFAVEPQPDGSFFIDRSSKWFSVILDYLRTRKLSLDIYDLKRAERIEFQTEVEFYGLSSLLDLFQGVFVSMFNASLALTFAFCTFRSFIDVVFLFHLQVRVAVFLWMLVRRESSCRTDSKPRP
jgi:hypothetical protein